MSISNVTQFANSLRAQINLQSGAEDMQSVSRNSTPEILSQAVSSLDLSGAEYGTLLLKNKLHDQAYAVVTFKEHQLSSLNTHISNVQSVVDQLAVTDQSDTLAYAALVEELSDREDQLSSFIGAQFHASELSIGALVETDLRGGLQNRLSASISNLSSQPVMTEAAIGRIMDADFSTEMAKLTKSMILSEANNYVLSGAQLGKSNLLMLLK